jgi:hypothetical protein
MLNDKDNSQKLVVFKDKAIRRILHENEWWFSVIDVVSVLTESNKPRDYWFRMKDRVKNEDKAELSTICRHFKMEAPDGKMRMTDCANTESIFRIIQSIPSPKAEPFKRWLAKIGYERIQEIEDPELASKRARAIYKDKGYSDDWVEKRMRSIAIREELTDEWKNRGITESKEFAILTAEITKAAFGMKPSEYKEYKGLKRENLRDHMNDLELIFSMLGEASTTEISRNTDAKGLGENRAAAKAGGTIAGNARRELEKKSGKSVISKQNYLSLPEQSSGKISSKDKDKFKT